MKKYLEPDINEFCGRFIIKLRSSTKEHLTTKERSIFLQICHNAIKYGWIKRLPLSYERVNYVSSSNIVASADEETFSLSNIVLTRLDNEPTPPSITFPEDIDNSMDLFMKFVPPLLRLDLINYLQHITKQYGITFSCKVDITKDASITIYVLKSKVDMIEEEFKKNDAHLYIEIESIDTDRGPLIQHTNNCS